MKTGPLLHSVSWVLITLLEVAFDSTLAQTPHTSYQAQW